MPLLKIRQLGTVRSQDTLMKSLMIPTNEQVTDMQDSIKSMTVKGDSFGTPCDKRESKSKNLEEKLSVGNFAIYINICKENLINLITLMCVYEEISENMNMV